MYQKKGILTKDKWDKWIYFTCMCCFETFSKHGDEYNCIHNPPIYFEKYKNKT